MNEFNLVAIIAAAFFIIAILQIVIRESSFQAKKERDIRALDIMFHSDFYVIGENGQIKKSIYKDGKREMVEL